MSAIDPIDGALLALVADDRVASKVLSVWVSMRLPASTTDAVIVRECSSMGISSMTWLALARWARTCGVKVTGFRRVDGHMGNGDMQYFAAVFRGQSPSDACATGR